MTASPLLADPSLRGIASEIERRHDESVKRLQDWVKMQTERDAGFQTATRVETDAHRAALD